MRSHHLAIKVHLYATPMDGVQRVPWIYEMSTKVDEIGSTLYRIDPWPSFLVKSLGGVRYDMAVPPFHVFIQPLLEVLADKSEHRLTSTYEVVADKLNLTETDRSEMLASGRQLRFANRIGWARLYLDKAGLIDAPKRGFVRITKRGEEALSSGEIVDLDYLERFPEFQAFRHSFNGDRQQSQSGTTTGFNPSMDAKTPEERLEDLVRSMNRELASTLLEQLRSKDAGFFEHVVVQLLVRMGYGGSIEEAGSVVGRSGDGGIDGIIKQDRLGLDNVYVQAKRYAPDRTVGSSDVRNLAGALQMRKATKGVLITTSSFTSDALATAEQIGTIVLVDGMQLANLMIEFNLGVATEATYAVKRIDQDFFDDWT